MNFLQLLVGDPSKKALKKFDGIVARINSLEPQFEQLSDEKLRAKTDEFRARFAKALENVEPDIAAESEQVSDDVARQKVRQRAEQRILDDLLPEAFATVREAGKRVFGMRHFDVQLLGGMVLHSGKIAEMRTGEGKTLMATLPSYLNALAGHGVHVVTVNDYLARRDGQWMGKLYNFLGLSVGAIGHESSWLYSGDTRLAKSDLDNEDNNQETQSQIANSKLPDEDWPNLRPVTRREAYAADITYGTNNEFGFDYLRDNMAGHPSQLVQRQLWYAVVDEVDSILIDEARTPLIISAPAEESGSLYMTFAAIAKRLKPTIDYVIDEKFRNVTINDDGIKKVEEWIGVPNLYSADHVQLVHHLEEALKAEGLFTKNKDYVVRDGEVVIVDEFTGRMMPGRRYSEGLHQAIEAKEGVEVQKESDTLATISFQNLFRLYAKLSGMTGTAFTEAEEFWQIYQREVVVVPTHRPMSRIDHQDLIYKTEAAKIAAVVEEVKRRSELGQPVLLGTISIQKNEKMSKALKAAGVKHQILNAKHHEKEAKIIAEAGKPGAVTLATNMAGRGVDIILGGELPKSGDTRLAIGDTETGKSKSQIANSQLQQEWEAQHQKVLAAGGLCVIGTERHEARRIDNQLRGRAGRQGDPGESQFYVSMDDDLMRVFGGDRMRGLMDRLGVPDDQPIQAKMISGSIESAQRRVEGHNFDIRKHLVEYDDVINKHREYIYRMRRSILVGDSRFAIGDMETEKTENPESQTANSQSLHEQTLLLMTDEQRAKYEEKAARWGMELVEQVERAVWLQSINTLWVDHLNAMEALRTGIGLRGYGQHDPLVAYRQEGHSLFERLQRGIEQEVTTILTNAEIQSQQPIAQPVQEHRRLNFQGADDSQTAGFSGDSRLANGDMGNVGASTSAGISNSKLHPPAGGANSDKVGRNDLCPCGSGKKYKKCHGK